MQQPELAPSLYAELLTVARHQTWQEQQKVQALAALLHRIFLAATDKENLGFTTLFARISYAAHRYQLPPETLSRVHYFRKRAARLSQPSAAVVPHASDVALGVRAVAESIQMYTGVAIPSEVVAWLQQLPTVQLKQPEIQAFKPYTRVVALADDRENSCLICIEEEQPSHPVRVRYNIADRNDNFNRSIASLRNTLGFPTTVNLLDVEIDRQGVYRPRAFVVEPDFLVDVSAVSECFNDAGVEPLHYLVKKFLPYEVTPALLKGNIANHFLDRLLHAPDAGWQQLIVEVFKLYPFIFAPLTDEEVRKITQESQVHYTTLREMTLGKGFQRQGIDAEDCFIEPTFFAERYGLQGRLDLFYKKDKRTAIVELKSGKAYRPNSYGIERSHFTQTLLYDLLVRAVFGEGTDPANYILYSGQSEQPLRFAPTVHAEQWEALNVRNQLVAIERRLAAIEPGTAEVNIFQKIQSSAASGYVSRDFLKFEQTYQQLSVLEKKYFHSFVGFITREHILAKIGEENTEHANGNAALWRNTFAQKQRAFSVLSHLQIIENQADKTEPYIVFKKTEHTHPLANFRVGDIVVTYPTTDVEADTVLQHQIIKCTLVELSPTTVKVQLRFRQYNLNAFPRDAFWNIEPDWMENGFQNMYRSLFEWATAPIEKRQLLLGVAPPRQHDDSAAQAPAYPQLTDEQQANFQKIIASKDYFLLWGPPGTGKTSVMLRALAQYWLENTDENILLLAYTNRAVDEICEALDAISPHTRKLYLRIGSRFATAPAYREQLLHVKIDQAENRQALRQILAQHRIFVGTVASFAAHDAVLKLKKFHRLVVDEASQLLEPQLLGLLSRFEHFVLIGDHRQLPAITVQSSSQSKVEDADLHGIHLHDLRDSYFERLYRRAEALQWHWAIGRLSYQGRMHAQIMEFPGRYFYHNCLKILPDNPRQQAKLPPVVDRAPDDPLFQIFTQTRVAFLASPPLHDALPDQKTHPFEADIIARLIVFFKKYWEKCGKVWHDDTLGVITPWRAQIAQIRQRLENAGLSADNFTIDTVERYQGGARDIILISTCIHFPEQLTHLTSLSEEQIDRKLNVALTRAREFLVLIGNPQILSLNEHYRIFIQNYLQPI